MRPNFEENMHLQLVGRKLWVRNILSKLGFNSSFQVVSQCVSSGIPEQKNNYSQEF